MMASLTGVIRELQEIRTALGLAINEYDEKGGIALTVAAFNASPNAKLDADYVCSGTADEEDIDAAFDALPAGGGKVVLTEGTFKPSKAILPCETGATLEGQGYSTLIEYDGDSLIGSGAIGHHDGTTYRDIVDCRITNLRIKNTGSTTQKPGIGIGYSDHIPQRVKIDHVEAENCCLWILCGAHHAITDCYVHDLVITNDDRAIGISGAGAEWASDSIVARNRIEIVEEMGICCGQSKRVTVSNNVLKDCSQGTEAFAIDNYTAVDLLMEGNVIESKNGILSEDADAGTVSIVNNTIKGTGLTAGYGIRVWRTETGKPQVDRALIEGNVVHYVQLGIVVDDEDKVAIANNLVENIGQSPISIGTTWQDFTRLHIHGNTLMKWARNDEWAGGIECSTANAIIEDNVLDQENYNNGRGIRNVDNPSWIRKNTILNCAADELYDIEAGVVIRDNIGYVTENSGTSTGTGAQQTIAHGLAETPNRIYLSNIEDGANPYQSAAADGTNIYITAVDTKDYVWKAEVV